MNLDKLKSLLAEATPRPWLSARVFVETEESRTVLVDWDNEDAALVVEMRNNIEALLAKLDALEVVVEAAHMFIGSLSARGPVHTDNNPPPPSTTHTIYVMRQALAALDNYRNAGKETT